MAATITLTRNDTLPDSSDKGDFYQLIDGSTFTISGIEISEIDWAGADADVAFARGSTTTTAFKITANSLTSGIGLYVTSSAGALTGALAKFELTGDNAGDAGEVVQIIQEHASSTSTTGLMIKQDGGAATTAPALHIEVNLAGGQAIYIEADDVTTESIMHITGDALTAGKLIELTSSSTNTTDRELVSIRNASAAANNTGVLFLNNDATDAPTDADKGYALHIDHENIANSPGIRLDGCANTADNNVACIFTANRGPTGAQTDIQGFIEINIDGTKRYVPYW